MVVTGGAHGIGAAIVRMAAGRGYLVGILDIDTAATNAMVAEVEGVALPAATNDEDAVIAAFDSFAAATRQSAPDVVVNCAGIVRFGPLRDLSVHDWRATVDVNLTGTFIVARTAAAAMAARGCGSIVNITSINGIAAGPNAGAYGATKAGIELLTQQMAIEFGPAGVRVNAVAPGLIDAGMSEAIYADDAIRQARSERVPLRRLGAPDDIASAVMFLAGAEAAYISGETIVVDGGVVRSIIATLPRPTQVDGVGRGDIAGNDEP